MISLTLAEAAAMCNAVVDGDDRAMISGVATDTRTLDPGQLFVALAAERDGHGFLVEALERGAAGAVVRKDATVPPSLPVLRVEDTLVALADLAAAIRRRLQCSVVAVTGSAGKTCTKDFTAAVLSRRFRTVASKGSFNNEIGVPLTVMSATEETEMIVAEVGSRGIGHIRALMPVVRPDVAIVTNVGPAHIGMFGSIESIVTAKRELVEALNAGGCAILNADDARVMSMRPGSSVDTITFGVSNAADVAAEDVMLDDHARARFTLRASGASVQVSLPVSGEHMVLNALAAAAVGLRYSIPIEVVAATLGLVETSAHRMRLIRSPRGWTVIDDTYNASPSSVSAALKSLKVMGRGRRTWAVLGHMAELGDASREEHDRIGRLAVRLGIDRIVTIGDEALALHEAARLEGMSPEDAVFATDAKRAVETIRSGLESGDVVLVKASRAAGLERVVEEIAR